MQLTKSLLAVVLMLGPAAFANPIAAPGEVSCYLPDFHHRRESGFSPDASLLCFKYFSIFTKAYDTF